MRSPRLVATRSGARPRTARRASAGARSSRCRGPRARRWSRPCSSAGSARPTRSPARGPAARRGARPARRAARRPRCGSRATTSRSSSRKSRSSRPPEAWTRKWTCTRSPSPSTRWESTASVSKRSRNSVEQALQQVAVVARARQRDDQRRAARVGVAAAEQPHLLALQREQRHDRAAQVVGRGGEQLVLRERVEQRDRGLVVVRALDQVLGAQDLAQLAVQQRRLARGLA